MYRSFLDWEWYPDTNCVRLALHFILKANYRAKKWKGLIIDRGQLVTSRGQLSRRDRTFGDANTHRNRQAG